MCGIFTFALWFVSLLRLGCSLLCSLWYAAEFYCLCFIVLAVACWLSGLFASKLLCRFMYSFFLKKIVRYGE
jgi:hypothetical protein